MDETIQRMDINIPIRRFSRFIVSQSLTRSSNSISLVDKNRLTYVFENKAQEFEIQQFKLVFHFTKGENRAYWYWSKFAYNG